MSRCNLESVRRAADERGDSVGLQVQMRQEALTGKQIGVGMEASMGQQTGIGRGGEAGDNLQTVRDIHGVRLETGIPWGQVMPFALNMLTRNKIGCLLPFSWRQEGEALFMTWPIDRYESLAERCALKGMSCESLRNLIHAIGRTLAEQSEYLIADLVVKLSVQHVYFHKTTGVPGLILLPHINETSIYEEAGRFFEELPRYIDHNDALAMRLMHRAAILLGGRSWQLNDLEGLVEDELSTPQMGADRISSGRAAGVIKENPSTNPAAGPTDSARQARTKLERGRFKFGFPSKKALSSEQKSLAEAAGETKMTEAENKKAEAAKRAEEEIKKTVATEKRTMGKARGDGKIEDPRQQKMRQISECIRPSKWGLLPARINPPCLLTSDGSRILISSTPFLIGKMKGHVDCAVADAHASRIHCKVFEHCSQYYVEDLNSTNGTLVDGMPLVPSEPYPLESGQRIEIGGTHFVFCLGGQV